MKPPSEDGGAVNKEIGLDAESSESAARVVAENKALNNDKDDRVSSPPNTVDSNGLEQKPSGLSCRKCGAMFQVRKLLSKHEGRCRLQGSKHIKLARGGQYICEVCRANRTTSEFSCQEHFKKHLFYSHDDWETLASYQRTVHQLLGAKSLKRIRSPLLNQIRAGNITTVLAEHLQDAYESYQGGCIEHHQSPESLTELIEGNPVATTHSTFNEPDEGLRSLRYCIYNKKREILLNLAEPVSALTLIKSGVMLDSLVDQSFPCMDWRESFISAPKSRGASMHPSIS